MEPNSPLARPARVIVLDAETAENLDLPIVHQDWESDVVLGHGLTQQVV
jgi:hypothetical protein